MNNRISGEIKNSIRKIVSLSEQAVKYLDNPSTASAGLAYLQYAAVLNGTVVTLCLSSAYTYHPEDILEFTSQFDTLMQECLHNYADGCCTRWNGSAFDDLKELASTLPLVSD